MVALTRDSAVKAARRFSDVAGLYPRIRGTMVPADTFDEVFVHIKAYRAGAGK